MMPNRVRRLTHRRLSADRAARGYRVPRQAASDLDDVRLVHADLAGMTSGQLLHEAARVLVALGQQNERHDLPWLIERLEAVTTERRARAAPENDNARRVRPGASPKDTW
jgi:hypothetical protein